MMIFIEEYKYKINNAIRMDHISRLCYLIEIQSEL